MMRTPDDRIDSCIDGLVAEARPVRPLRPPAIRLTFWLGAVAVVAAAVAAVGLRRDVAARLAAPGFVGELACLVGATIVAAWVALRGSVPGLDAGRARLVLVATLIAAGVLGLGDTDVSVATPLASFVGRGVPCAVWSVVLTLAPGLLLVSAVRRGLPLRPARSFAAAGLAAALAAYALMRLRCALDETVHVAVWHGGPVVLATCVAALAGHAVTRARRAARTAR